MEKPSVHLSRPRALLLVLIVANGLAAIAFVLTQPTTASTANLPVSSSAWLTYLHDPSRTSASSASLGPLITPRWTHEVSGMVASEPVIANNRVYVTAWDGNLYALDAFDGHEIWHRFLGLYKFINGCPGEGGNVAGTTSSPTLDLGAGLLYVAALSPTVVITQGTNYTQNAGIYLYAVSSSTGDIAWQAQVSDKIDNYPWSSPLVANGHAYVGNASSGDCPLTQGELVSVNLGGAHDVTRVAMSPDSLTVYPSALVTTGNYLTITPSLLPDKSNWDFTATLTTQSINSISAKTFIQLHHADLSTVYTPSLKVGTDTNPCNNPGSLTFVQDLDTGQLPDASGNITFARAISIDTTTLNDGKHALVVAGLVPCAKLAPGIGGGIWSSPTFDPVTHRVFVTTGTPTPPCVPTTPCTGARGTLGKLSAAVVGINADTLAVDWSWQVPFQDQNNDADFGATPTLCTADNNHRVLGVANKNGNFYAFDADALGDPIWQRTIAIGGGGPEGGQGSISSAACVNGVYYVGAGIPSGASVCTGYSGQVWALAPATGSPRWANPRCTSVILGPITAANGLLIYGVDCRAAVYLPSCERRVEVLDATTGSVRYRGATGDLPALGDIVSGAAVVDGWFVIGDGLPGPPATLDNPYSPYFPLTSTIRAFNARLGLYLPLIVK